MSENEVNNQPQGCPNGPGPNGPNPPNNNEKEVTFIISRHKKFFEMLGSPRMAFRATVMMATFLMVLFLGLTLLTLTLKKNYPYSLIKSNEYGALLMQSEDIEIYNFMFNTAEIFANSGVEVKKGDKLTIQATGKFHTAVQHLADVNIDAIWLGPEGDENPIDPRDKELQKKDVLLAHGITPESLLCFILDNDEEKCLEDYVKAQSDFLKARQKYDKCIKEMEDDNLSAEQKKKLEKDTTVLGKEQQKKFKDRAKCLKKVDSVVIMPHKTEKIGKAKEFNAWQDGKLFFVINDIIFTERINDSIKVVFDKPDGIKWSTTTTYNDDYNNRFIICPDAWYLDNVGSFLITIEKSQEK